MWYTTPINKEAKFGSLFHDIALKGYQRQNASDDLKKDSIQLEYLSRRSRKMTKNSPRPSSFLPPELSMHPKDTRRSLYIYETDLPIAYRFGETEKVKKFCTGSKYVGGYHQLGMSGRGIYKYPHGVIYDGYFNQNGEFHGSGTLVYPAGQKIEGIWHNGRLTKGASFMCYDDNTMSSDYCKTPDRRFQIEINQELRPAGQEYLTNAPVPNPIPPGMYDTGSGYYDPIYKLIYDYNDPCKSIPIKKAHGDDKEIIYKLLMEKTLSNEMVLSGLRKRVPPTIAIIESIPTAEYVKWIHSNCRKAADEPIGYRKDLYEVWTPGYRRDEYGISLDTYCSRVIEHDDQVSKFCQLSNLLGQPTLHRKVSWNRYSKMYSFICRYPSLAASGRTSSLHDFLEILKTDSVAQSKKMIFLLRRKSKRTGSKVSPTMQSIRSGYGLKFVKLQHNLSKRSTRTT